MLRERDCIAGCSFLTENPMVVERGKPLASVRFPLSFKLTFDVLVPSYVIPSMTMSTAYLLSLFSETILESFVDVKITDTAGFAFVYRNADLIDPSEGALGLMNNANAVWTTVEMTYEVLNAAESNAKLTFATSAQAHKLVHTISATNGGTLGIHEPLSLYVSSAYGDSANDCYIRNVHITCKSPTPSFQRFVQCLICCSHDVL